MTKPADGVPPLVTKPVPDAPVSLVLESRLTKVARVVAIVRDVVVILVFALALYFGSAVLSRVGDVTDGGVTGETPTACVSPTTDQWGTFCPETPGG